MGEDILDKLSAEREIKTIGRIGGGGGVVMMSCDIVQEAIEEVARLREERRWIPVGERLPELEQHVLVFCQHVPGHGGSWVGMHVAYRRADGLWMEPAEPCDVSVVTHWMPLPAPPKGGEVE